MWDTKEIVGAIIATGLLSAFARELFDWLRSRRTKKQETRYIAMRAAIALEEFAEACASLCNEMEASQQVYGDVKASSLPPAPIYPDDVNWRLIDNEMADELLSFLNGISTKQREANYGANFESNPWELHTAAEGLGGIAWRLAKKLRERYGLTSRSYLDRIYPERPC